MTAADEIQHLRAKLQKQRNEIGRLVRIIADLNLERREMRGAMAEVRDLLLSGQIREALAALGLLPSSKH